MNRKKDTNKEALLIARLDRDIQDIEACASQMRFDQIWEYMTLLSLYKHLHWHLKYEYLAAGMSEADVQKMYEFDLEYFRLLRCEALHAVNPQEMMGFDPETGDYHYMDMDELPASELRPTYPDAMSDWFEDIENEDMLQEIMAFPPDYVQIINLLIQGKTHEQISETLGVCRTSITNKVARMKKSLGIFLLT